MTDDDGAQLLSVITTEHFVLQGARSTTTSESSSRASLFLGATSSTLIALGFVAGDRTAFNALALVVLPTLWMLGLLTFVRLVESSVEDLLYARAINRLRHHYLDVAGPHANLFMLPAHDDPVGTLRAMGLRARPDRPWQVLFTFASAIAIVSSVVAGGAIGVLIGPVLELPLGIAVGAGVACALVSMLGMLRWQARRQLEGAGFGESLFPAPTAGP